MLLIFDLDDTLFPRLPDGFTDNQLRASKPHAELLTLLRNTRYIHVLVTKGSPQQQRRKIQALGVGHYFHRIMICSHDEEKKECFRQILAEFPSQQAWVIGDRLDAEIRYGNQLGLKTIHLRQGKYKDLLPVTSQDHPTHQITRRSELLSLFP